MSKTSLVKKHTNAQLYDGYHCEYRNRKSNEYILEHTTEISDDEVIFNVCLKLNTNSRTGKKILREMLEKQSSAVKIMLQKTDREHNIDVREEKVAPLYQLPDEIIEKL